MCQIAVSMVDNGSPYSNEQLSMICVSLGVVLIHTRVRDGASKEKRDVPLWAVYAAAGCGTEVVTGHRGTWKGGIWDPQKFLCFAQRIRPIFGKR